MSSVASTNGRSAPASPTSSRTQVPERAPAGPASAAAPAAASGGSASSGAASAKMPPMARTETKPTPSQTADSPARAAKAKALEAAVGQIEKNFGKGSIMRLDNESVPVIPAISTGALSLDIALGGRGLPRGRVVEVFGPESSGKTTLALTVIANVQKAGGVAAFVDAEHALDPSWAKRIGVNLDEIGSGTQLFEFLHVLIDVVRGKHVGVIVPRRPAFVINVLELLDAVLPGDGGAELIEQIEPVAGAPEHNLFVVDGLARFELFAFAIGPDHEGPVLQREVRQKNAPGQRAGEQILPFREPDQLIHVAGTLLGLRAEVLPQ